jgi:hypothetical protein
MEMQLEETLYLSLITVYSSANGTISLWLATQSLQAQQPLIFHIKINMIDKTGDFHNRYLVPPCVFLRHFL